MEKEAVLSKTKEAISGFETQNILEFFQNTTIQTILDNPKVLAAFCLVLVYICIRPSRLLLLFLFTILSLLLLVRYTLPSAGQPLDVQSTLPFAFGCLAIGAILLYFVFVK